MSMKILLSTGYITTFLLGSVCPLQMAAAMPVTQDSMQHEEMNMTPMTPPMTPVAFMSVAPVISRSAHAAMPVLPSGNCTMGHCITMDHSNQHEVAASSLSIQLIGGAVLPVAFTSELLPIDSPSAPPPETASTHLAQTVSTIVLRV